MISEKDMDIKLMLLNPLLINNAVTQYTLRWFRTKASLINHVIFFLTSSSLINPYSTLYSQGFDFELNSSALNGQTNNSNVRGDNNIKAATDNGS
jgi:hypothetical protein